MENSKHSSEPTGYMASMTSMGGMPSMPGMNMGFNPYPYYDMPRDNKKAKKK